MINTDAKLNRNMQFMVTQGVGRRIEALALQEGDKLSNILRKLVIDSLERWEKSAPGRRRK